MERSSHWPTVRAAFLKDHATCAACGGDDYLQVHHIVPFYKDKGLELEPSNLVTLCEQPSHNCHYVWGHFMDWYAYNPDVVRDAGHYLKLAGQKKT